MISLRTYEREAMGFIKEHGFDRFFIYGIKRGFVKECEINNCVKYIFEDLISKENYEDCALLKREYDSYLERKQQGFQLVTK